MRNLLAVSLVIAATAVTAADTATIDHWRAADVQALGALLAPKVDATGFAIAGRLLDREGYFATVVRREPGPGFAEAHRDYTDVYFVTEGGGTLITGGTIPDARETTPGEPRGTRIDGGMRRAIAAGDVVHIPPGIPHNVEVAAGGKITYFIVKIQRRSIAGVPSMARGSSDLIQRFLRQDHRTGCSIGSALRRPAG